MTRISTGLCALIFMAMVAASPVQAQTIDNMMQSIGQGASNMMKGFDTGKLNAKPQRDLMTLAIGGLVGFAVGGFLTNLGILNVQVLGLAIIPMASGLAGLYLANEGYFDGARNLIGPKPTMQ